MADKHALVTGIHGFCGRYLGLHLLQHGYTVSGIDLAPSESIADITVHIGDICNPAFVQKVMHTIRPTHIFHLAALISSRADLETLYDINVRGTEHLLKAVRAADIDPVILITSSSAVYGLVDNSHVPIRETQPFHPLNAYAVSKIAQEMLAYTYYARYGLNVIRTRAFNLVGPGQPPSLVCSALAKQIAEIEAGQAESLLRVGNLGPQRDFVDVRDGAHAYRLAAQHGQPGEVYNVCSEKSVSIQTCLDELLRLARIPIEIEQDPDRIRPLDIPVSVGDGDLLHKQTGWRPVIPLEQSLADLLDDWRS
jgi:GDP-4-dehydro-6-deoxy-D-mannose reductase